MEKITQLVKPMDSEEFDNYLEFNRASRVMGDLNKGILHLDSFASTSKYKSIRRAIKRGNVSYNGIDFPSRPFNNRANTSNRKNTHSRVTNELKKMYYEQYKHKFRS